MLNDVHLMGKLPVQDRDLLSRLSQYFDNLEARLREAQGWFIFNARRERSARITRYITAQLAGFRPLISSYHLVWRDFALQAYMSEVEMAGWSPTEEVPQPGNRVEQEHRIATQVSRGTSFHMLSSDLLILSGLAPSQAYEVLYLDKIVATRHGRHLASILITPLMPHELADRFHLVKGAGDLWQRFLDRMYQTSLIAL